MSIYGIYNQLPPEFCATRSLISVYKEAIASNNIDKLNSILKSTSEIKNKCKTFIDQTWDGFRILINLDNMNILIEGGSYDLSSALLIITELYNLIVLAESIVDVGTHLQAIRNAKVHSKNRLISKIGTGKKIYATPLTNGSDPVKNLFVALMTFGERIQSNAIDKLVSIGAVNIIHKDSLSYTVELTVYGKSYYNQIKKDGN